MKKNHNFKKIISATLVLTFVISVSIKGGTQNVLAYQKNTEKTIASLECSKEDLKFIKKISADIPLTSEGTANAMIACNSLDMYTDEENNTYYYLSGTDALCGFQKEQYYGFKSNSPVSQDTAIQIANKFLETVLDDFDEYTLLFSEYAKCDAVYHIQYSYCINGIPTDDLINVYVQESGEIGAFLMMRRGMYKDIVLPYKISIMNRSDDVVSQFISLTNEGLALIRTYEKLDSNQIPLIQQEAILLQCVGEN